MTAGDAPQLIDERTAAGILELARGVHEQLYRPWQDSGECGNVPANSVQVPFVALINYQEIDVGALVVRIPGSPIRKDRVLGPERSDHRCHERSDRIDLHGSLYPEPRMETRRPPTPIRNGGFRGSKFDWVTDAFEA